jgi:RND family efflux transporter MFP subunit
MRQPLAALPPRGFVAGVLVALAMIPVAALSAGAQPAEQPKNPTSSPPTPQRSGGERSRAFDSPEWARSFEGLRHFTQPSRDAIMGFSFPTEVREVKVKGGDRVKAGDLLVRARDAEAEAALRQQEHRTKNDTEIRDATSKHELAEIELKAIESARQGSGSTEQEYLRAKNTVESMKIAIEAANWRFQDQELALGRLQADLDRYRLIAPFDGVVESVKLDAGAAVADSQPVLRVVNIDRLWVAVPTPTETVMRLGLKPGDAAWVLMDTPEDPVVLAGRVIEVSPVAEFASQKTIVKVEIENPRGRPAGLAAWVRFTEPTGEWMERILKGEGTAGGGAEAGSEADSEVGDAR